MDNLISIYIYLFCLFKFFDFKFYVLWFTLIGNFFPENINLLLELIHSILKEHFSTNIQFIY